MLVQLERHAPPAIAGFRNFLTQAREIQVCLEISGVYDIAAVGAFTPTMVELGAQLFELFHATAGQHHSSART